jgi:hypothetical protein
VDGQEAGKQGFLYAVPVVQTLTHMQGYRPRPTYLPALCDATVASVTVSVVLCCGAVPALRAIHCYLCGKCLPYWCCTAGSTNHLGIPAGVDACQAQQLGRGVLARHKGTGHALVHILCTGCEHTCAFSHQQSCTHVHMNDALTGTVPWPAVFAGW